MRIVCIYNYEDYYNITIGKSYEVIEYDMIEYRIIDDDGCLIWYPKKWFKPLSEYRNETINKLLEDEN